jgi:hypothetical protein
MTPKDPGWGKPRFEVIAEPQPLFWIVWDNEIGAPASISRFSSYRTAERLCERIENAEKTGKRRIRPKTPK